MITDQDFAKMKWNIKLVPPETPITVHFPELHEIFKEYITGKFNFTDITTDQIFRYIVYTYHKHSPLLKEDDLNLRKQMALQLSGIKNINIDSKGVLDVVSNKDNDVVASIFQFLKFEKDMRYTTLVASVESLYNLNAALIEASQDKNKGRNTGEIISNIQEVEKVIMKYSEEVFRGDTMLADFVAANNILDQRKKITPEQYANAKKQR